MRSAKRVFSAVALLAALALLTTLLLAACGGGDGGNGPTPTPEPGTVLDPPRDLADFTLTSHTGDPLSLSDLRGQVVVIYFGYTFCPDVCPLTLAAYKRTLAILGEDADRVAVVFISVDGARDTPERLALYVKAFDPDFIGLTGDDAAIRAVAQDYGVFYQRQTYDSSAANYLVDHTASTFIVGPEGRLRIIYPFDTDPAVMARGISRLLAEG